MSRGIHHVGLAVRSVEEVTTFFEEVFDAQWTNYSMETGEFLSRMIMVGTGLFELLEPRGKGGLIERFLDTNGEGIHHVSIVVDSLDEVLTACEKKGLRVVGNRFIHPKSAHGVLIELLDGKELR